jgi:hypothetical protein
MSAQQIEPGTAAALRAYLQQIKSDTAEVEALTAARLLHKIDELLAETAWLQSKRSAAAPIFAARMLARLEAIAIELRELNLLTDGQTVICAVQS